MNFFARVNVEYFNRGWNRDLSWLLKGRLNWSWRRNQSLSWSWRRNQSLSWSWKGCLTESVK